MSASKVKLTGWLVRETDAALLIQNTNDNSPARVSAWIPRSQVSYMKKHGANVGEMRKLHMTVAGWLMRDKNLSKFPEDYV